MAYKLMIGKITVNSFLLASLFLLPKIASAATFKTLYHFTHKTDGGDPVGGVVEDAAGTIYGETFQGGGVPCSGGNCNNCGTVWEYTP